MFIINDVDVDLKVLSVAKIVDKSTNTDVYLRERGGLTYPTKYQTEKISISVGYDISKIDHRMDFSTLAMEVDEYPFVFIQSEKVQSMTYRFTERDRAFSETSVQVFMVESVSVSMSQESKDFAVININLLPYNIYALVDDFSFISYEKNEDGTFRILYGIKEPGMSEVYKDFFRTRKENVYKRVTSFLSSNQNSDVRIMAPYFTNKLPTDEIGIIDVEQISYTDVTGGKPSIRNEDGTATDTGDEIESFMSYKSDGTTEDKYKSTRYVYWKGEVFTSDKLVENAVTSVEVRRTNTIVAQPISGHPYPVIQYLGKGEGYFTISFISKTGENSSNGEIITPYTIFRSLLEKYNYNLSAESRFAAYNVFKIKSILTLLFDIEGYVPSQVYLQNNSTDKLDEYSATFVESRPFDLKDITKGKIEKNKDSNFSLARMLEIIKATHNGLISSGTVDPSINEASIHYIDLSTVGVGVAVEDYLRVSIDSSIADFAKRFYSELVSFSRTRNSYASASSLFLDMETIERAGSVIGYNLAETVGLNEERKKETVSWFIFKKMTEAVAAKDNEITEEVLLIRSMIVKTAELVSVDPNRELYIPVVNLQDGDSLETEYTSSEFFKFRSESAKDLRLGQAFNISQDNPYLGIRDPRSLSCAPFLVWSPLLSATEIESEYLRNAKEIDTFFAETYGDGDRIENEAKRISKNDLGVDRGGKEEEEAPAYLTNLIYGPPGMFNPEMTNDMAGLQGIANNIAESVVNFITGKPKSLIDFIGAKDSGASGKDSLNTVFCIKTSHGLDLTKMTIRELLAKQAEWKTANLENPKCGKERKNRSSAAAGRFQMMDYTLRSALELGIVSPNDKFDENTQNRLGLWSATTKTKKRLALANEYVDKRNKWKSGSLSYYDYSLARNRYMNSLAKEWSSLPKTDGTYSYDGQGGYLSVKDMTEAMDTLPLYTKDIYKSASFASKIAIPLELMSAVAPTASPDITPEPVIPEKDTIENTQTVEQAFIEKYAGKIPSSSGSPTGTSATTSRSISSGSPDSGSRTEEEVAIYSQLNKLGTVTDYTVFDHDINLQVQAKDATQIFRNGFNMAFPTVKAYIVFGGNNDLANVFSPHKPNYIELNGITSCMVTMNDIDNPMDVAYLELASPGRVYTDQALFWESFKTAIDFEKFGTSEELRMLVSMMTVTPGNRLHIKAGVGNDPNKLETIFNGEIVSVSEEGTLTVVAEGYGREFLLAKHGIENVVVLSSLYNSGTRESLAHILIMFDEIQNMGRKSRSTADFFVSAFFRTISGALSGGINSLAEIEPEARTLVSGEGSDDTFSYLMLGSQIDRVEAYTRQPTLKNIYASEVTSVDGEFQYSLSAVLDTTRVKNNYIVMHGNTAWDALQCIAYRHPNTLTKPMFFENEMSLFFGIKDQCYIANDISERIQKLAVSGTDREIYEKMKFKRYKAVSQIHYVSSGVNLISNRMKVSSDFATRVSVYQSELSDIIASPPGEIMVSEDVEVLQVQFDDNLRPQSIRDCELKMNGCDSKIAAIRYGTSHLIREVQKMYDGEIVILGNEKIKNGDVVFLNDMERGLTGFVEVAECSHTFGARTGFITTFRPKLMAEARNPYFSVLGRKLRVVFSKAFANAIGRIANNINRSQLFSYLDEYIDHMGAISSPADYSWLPLQSIAHNILSQKKGDTAASGTYTLAAVGFSTYLTYGAAAAIGRMASSHASAIANNSIIRTGRAFTSVAGRWVTAIAPQTVQQGIMSLAQTMQAKVAQGISGGVIRLFTSAIRHPAIATITVLASMIMLPAISSLERYLLVRDPIDIAPLIIFGRPYIVGIIGAQNEGVFFDTAENIKRSLVGIKKTFMYDFNYADHSNEYNLSVFDKDYVEY